MDYKNLISNVAMIQTFLAGAGLLAPQAQSGNLLDKMSYYMVAVVVSSVIGIGFLLAGLYLYLITIMPSYQVCMIMGAVIFGLGLIIFLSRIFVVYMIQRRLKKSIKNIYEEIKDVLGDMSEQIEKPITENPKLGLVIALLAGFLLGKNLLKD